MSQPPSPQELDTLRREAGEARRFARYREAIERNQRRLAAWQARNNPSEEVLALLELAQDHLTLREPLVALSCLSQAQARAQAAPELQNRVLHTLSDLYVQLGLVEQAISVLETIGSPDTSEQTRLMYLYLGRGQREKAEACFVRARAHFRQQGVARQEANLVLAWGNALADRTVQTEGTELLMAALAQATTPPERLQILSLRATMLGLLQRDAEALATFEHAQAQSLDPSLWQEHAGVLSAFASFCYFSRRTDGKQRAQALLSELRDFARQHQSPTDERGALQKVLDFARYEKDSIAQAAACAALIDLCLEQGWRQDLPYFQEQHAQALQALGRHAEAAAACRAAVAVLEQRRRTYAALTEADRALRQGSRSVYERLLSLLAPTSPEVFPRVQQLKARTLREQLSLPPPREAPAPEETQLRARCEQLNAALIAEGQRNAVGGKKRFVTLQAELTEAERALARYYDQLHARAPERALRHVAVEVSQEAVQAKLPPQTLLLDFLVPTTPEAPVRLLALTASTAHFVTCPTPVEALRQQVAALRHACSRPERPWQAAAQALAQSLLAPVAGLLAAAERVVVCPDGFLWEVPFGVLLRPEQVLQQAFSAALWHQQRTRSQPTPRPLPLLAVAAPQTPSLTRPIIAPERPIIAPERPIVAPERSVFLPTTEALAPLPGARREVEALARLFPGTKALTGAAAQESRVKAELGHYRWLHIAAHAFINDASPELSCLVLSDPQDPLREDGFLTARELGELDLSGLELVTLSACNTARGQALTGEGIRGLGWSLTGAGARNLVLSQWSVADTVTAEGMIAFYQALQKGHGKPLALHTAKAQLRRRYPHPYHWAAFILLGTGD